VFFLGQVDTLLHGSGIRTAGASRDPLSARFPRPCDPDIFHSYLCSNLLQCDQHMPKRLHSRRFEEKFIPYAAEPCGHPSQMKSRSSLPPASSGLWLPPSLKRVTAFLIRMTPPPHAHFMTLKATPESPRSFFFFFYSIARFRPSGDSLFSFLLWLL
jgi:hypothetical protein